MHIGIRQFTKYAQKPLAGFFAVWLTGIVFLLCCDMPGARAAEREFCPIAKAKKDCDKSKGETQAVTSAEYTFDCCGFIPAIFDKVRKFENVQKVVPPAAVPFIERPVFAALPAHTNSFDLYGSFVPIQNKAFIKNCVFRI